MQIHFQQEPVETAFLAFAQERPVTFGAPIVVSMQAIADQSLSPGTSGEQLHAEV